VLAWVVIMAMFLTWGLVAGRLARWSITAPIAMVLAGVALTAGSTPVFVINFDRAGAEQAAEVVLAILLFVDATEVPGGMFGPEPKLTMRLLLIALPLTLLLAVGAGYLALPGHGFWVVAVVATVVVPIDLAPAAALIREHRIPRRLRDLLNVESGLNDGIVAPLFLFCLAAATAHGPESRPVNALLDAGPAVLIAVGVGAVVGEVSGRLLRWAWHRGWTQPSPLRVGVAALPVMAYGLSIVLSGNGFVAAFVAGVFFGRSARKLPADVLHLAEDLGTTLSLVAWFVFGRLINETLGSGGIMAATVYALLVLTVVRIVPVAVALVGTSTTWTDRLFLGWLGPRGIASIVFGLLAFIELSPPDSDFVARIMVVTVLLSAILHGLSLSPIAALYARRPIDEPGRLDRPG
jgi:sodium/hydrogen antiporter